MERARSEIQIPGIGVGCRSQDLVDCPHRRLRVVRENALSVPSQTDCCELAISRDEK
jgi:hypothetical protein